MTSNVNFEKSRKPVSHRRCPRCAEVHEFLVHGYCLGCNGEMRAEFAAANAAIKAAFERSIVEADLHQELIQSESL
jgi:hypothetical protein